MPALYDTLVPWYRLFTPPEDYADEAGSYRDALRAALGPGRATLLELGAGAGHNAFHLKRDFSCTLTDLSPAMLGLSRELNPDCEHLTGDLRTLRLGRTFDAVFLHDAVMYLLDEADLRAAFETAYVHLRPGGAAVFAPDAFTGTFRERIEFHEQSAGSRALTCVEWAWDPDPSDTTFRTEFQFLLRDGRDVTSVHDPHVEGLFPEEAWAKWLREAGFHVERFERPLDEPGTFDLGFVCRK